jgi:hypothetical protein
MKDKRVTVADIDRALQKLSENSKRPDNYIFISTDEKEAFLSMRQTAESDIS